MISFTESVELPDDFLQVLAICSEYNCKFPLLFLKENESSEEGRNDMVLAFSEHLHQVLLLRRQLLGGCLIRSHFISILLMVTFILIFFPEWLSIKYFVGDSTWVIQLFFCTFWQSKRFQHLFQGAFELCSWTTLSSKAHDSVLDDSFILCGIRVSFFCRIMLLKVLVVTLNLHWAFSSI